VRNAVRARGWRASDNSQFFLPVISVSAGHSPQTAVCPTRLLETQQCTLEKLLLTADSSLSVSHPSPLPPHRLGKSSALLWYFLHPANWITIRDVIRGGSFYFVFSVQSFIRTWVRALIDRFMSPWRRQAWRKVVPGVPEVQARYYLETLVFLEDHAAAISLWLPTVITLFRPFVTFSDESGWDHEAGKSACPQYLATAQITLISVKLCLAFSKVQCCRDVRNATLRNHLMYFVLPRGVWISLASKFNCFMIYNVVTHLTVGISYVLRRKQAFPQLTLVSGVLQKSFRHTYIHSYIHTYKMWNFKSIRANVTLVIYIYIYIYIYKTNKTDIIICCHQFQTRPCVHQKCCIISISVMCSGVQFMMWGAQNCKQSVPVSRVSIHELLGSRNSVPENPKNYNVHTKSKFIITFVTNYIL